MKKTTTTNIEAIIAELAKNHKNMKEQIASVKVTLDVMEAESEKMQSALEKAMIELMKAKADDSKKKPSKLWHITYTFHGVTKEFWSARDVYDALGGRTVKGFCAMVDGCKRGDCVQLHRSAIKLCGCPEYKGDSLSYWMDAEAVDCATEWMANKERKVGTRSKVYRDYDEEDMVRRYTEVNNANVVAKEFNVDTNTVYLALKRNGVKPCGKSGRKSKVTPEIESAIIRLHRDGGFTQKEIAELVDIHPRTVCRVLRNNGIGRGLDH